MTHTGRPQGHTNAVPRVQGARHRLQQDAGSRRLLIAGRVVAGLTALAVVTATGIGWSSYRTLTGGITTSDALSGAATSTGGAQNCTPGTRPWAATTPTS
jgi:hypothetical protein